MPYGIFCFNDKTEWETCQEQKERFLIRQHSGEGGEKIALPRVNHQAPGEKIKNAVKSTLSERRHPFLTKGKSGIKRIEY